MKPSDEEQKGRQKKSGPKTRTKHDVAEVVEPLVQALDESGRAYEAAGRRTENVRLRKVFREIAERRRWFVSRLQELLVNERAPQPSFMALPGESWRDLGDPLSEGDSGLLAELERLEDSMLSRYQGALAHRELSPGLWRTLEEQRRVIAEAHDRVRELRDSRRSVRRA